MKERGRFLHQDPDGTIFISFERGGKGVPIERLLPLSGRGSGFSDFKITSYLDLADLVLATPNDWAKFGQQAKRVKIKSGQTAKVSPPVTNLDFLKLRMPNGDLDAKRAADLFTVVAAYWTAAENELALEPGLVATLWHSGMKPEPIIKYIRDFTNPAGKLTLGGMKDERGYQILNKVVETYKSVREYSADTILSQDEIETLLSTWHIATRDAQPNSTEATNSVLHWADYKRIGLVDAAGGAALDNVCRVARQVFSTEKPPSFAELTIWTDAHLVTSNAPASAHSNAAKALLKKKRKQGKVNRKRGRR